MNKLSALTLAIVFTTSLYAEGFVETVNTGSSNASKFTTISDAPLLGGIVDTTLVTTGVALWGFTQWNWGTEKFHFHSEGWFEKESKTGGSDKTGHLYMTYMLSRIVASRMQDRGLSLKWASFWGSVSGLTSMTLLEIGDGTSPYGFSKEDFIADSIGATMAFLVRAYPKVDEFIDVRFEYWPSGNSKGRTDFTTDYSSMRHLVALKLLGFDALKHTPLSLVEFQVGYYSRGFRSYDTVQESQHLYVGIGISLADLARRSEINILKNTFEFYQPGHTYIETDIWSRPE